jgi:hypothetical protein
LSLAPPPHLRVEAGAHGRAAERELAKLRHGRFDGGQSMLDLRHPAADFLAERERGLRRVSTKYYYSSTHI